MNSYRLQRWSRMSRSETCTTSVLREDRTLAKKFEAVHRKTVASKSPMPMVWRQTPRSPFLLLRSFLSDRTGEDVDSVDSLGSSPGAADVPGSGRSKLSVGTGGAGPFMATVDFPTGGFAWEHSTLVSKLLSLLYGKEICSSLP